MQVILFLSVIILAYFLLRFILNAIIRARKSEHKESQTPPTSHTMVRCAQCGVHLPQSEAYYDGRHTYCSEGHLRLGPNLGGDGDGALHESSDGD
jgi:uncharacterized protein